MLTEQQIERYSRQIVLPQLGGRGQERLLSAAIAVVGHGPTSTAAATYLAAAGIGNLMIAEPSLRSDVEGLNPDCRVSPLPSPLTGSAAADVARSCRVVLANNLAHDVGAVLAAACVAERTPLVWGESVGSAGLIAVFAPRHGASPCYACVAAHASALLGTGDTGHPLAEATAAFIGTLQATEAIKSLLGLEACPAGRVLTYDALAGSLGDVTVAQRPDCPTCTVPSR